MSCNKPMIRVETFETYKKIDGGTAYKAKFYSDPDLYDKDFGKFGNRSGYIRKIGLIPCGHCVGCRLDYSRDKAVQLSLEGMNPIYKSNEKWFLTLTYDDMHIRTHTTINLETGELFEGTSIHKQDMQNFWKRIRKSYLKNDEKLKYLNVMEYGNKTYRPHGHAIVFGLPLDESKFKRQGNNSSGDAYFTSKELTDIWGLGEVIIGEVTFKSIGYVARYTLKKTKAQYDDWWYMSQGKEKEWCSMSEGMGRWYYDLHKHEIYKTDLVPVKDTNGNLCKPPRSYDRLYKTEYPDLWEEVARKREKSAIAHELGQRDQTNLQPWQRRIIKEQIIKDKMKDIRGEGNGI